MKFHTCTRGLLAAAISVVAFASGTGVAHAQPDPFPPPVPGVIDDLLTQTPVFFSSPNDEGGPGKDWGGVGMYCQNLGVHCR